MSMPTTSHTTGATTIITVDSTLGAILVGGLLSMTLWGIACTQTFDYFMDNTDARLQRWIVALLSVLDTLGSAMISHLVYFLLVTNYTNSFGQGTPWSMNCFSIVTGVSNFIIRTMFARRIYQFGQKNRLVPAWIVTISFCELVSSIMTAVAASSVITPKVLQDLGKLLYISTAFSIVGDFSVTIALCWLLQSAKSGFRRSDSVVNILLVYVVNTGLLVSVSATVRLITYVVMPDNLVFVSFSFLMTKLYLNAYLASLNARKRLRGKTSDSDIPLSGLDLPSSQRKNTQGAVLSDNEKRASQFHNPALAISFQTTVQRGDDVTNDLKGLAHPV